MGLSNDMSPADIGALMGNNGGCGDSAWWIIILFLFAFTGGFGNNANGAQSNYVLTSDFAQLSRQLDQGIDRLALQGNNIANGLCDGFYTQAQLVNGVNTNILQSTNTLQSQLSSCCCENQRNTDALRYDMSQMIASVNANTTAQVQAIKDMLAQDKIESLQHQVNELQLSASQCAQNQYLISQLKGCGYGYCGCNS